MKTKDGHQMWQVVPASEYNKGSGFLIEMWNYWNSSAEPSWALPPFEDSFPELGQNFVTEADAWIALKAYGFV